jgi:preprotein translocase subunit SecY
MLEALRNAWRLPDVRNKLLITGLILLIYRFAAHVPVVGVNGDNLSALMNSTEPGAGLVGVLDMLSGGAVARFSVIANGVYPYITASIIFQLLVPVIPRLQQLQKEPGGQETIQRYTYYATIPMAILQGFGQIQLFSAISATGTAGGEIIPGFGSELLLTLSVLSTMVAGTMFAVWLGDLITEQGIGNGISIIIFAGIVSGAPANLLNLWTNSLHQAYDIGLFVIITLICVIGAILIQEGVRRIPVQYGKRVRGRKQYGGASTHIPLRINPVGMIPLIFAQAVIAFPAILVSFFPESGFRDAVVESFGSQRGGVYWFTFFVLTVGFTFFYSEVMVGNQGLADSLQRNGGFIPGIRPGKRTEEYILRVTRRITFVGAVFLGLIAVVPGMVDYTNGIIWPGESTVGGTNAASVLSGAGLIIVVGVVIDFMRQLEAQLVMRNYEGFMK